MNSHQQKIKERVEKSVRSVEGMSRSERQEEIVSMVRKVSGLLPVEWSDELLGKMILIEKLAYDDGVKSTGTQNGL